jgi:hypothetical protein
LDYDLSPVGRTNTPDKLRHAFPDTPDRWKCNFFSRSGVNIEELVIQVIADQTCFERNVSFLQMKGDPMINHFQRFHPSIIVREQSTHKAHWSLIIVLLVVCFLLPLGDGVRYHVFIVFGDRSLTWQDISSILVYNIPWAVLMPFALCVFWGGQFLAIRLFRGRGDFLTHGWADLVCFTPCVVAKGCLLLLPIDLWTPILPLLLVSGFFYMYVLNIWVMRVIHGVPWKVALVSTLLGSLAIPPAILVLMDLYLTFGIITFPSPN